MGRFQNCNMDGEIMSSMYVDLERNDPSIVIDCSTMPSMTRQEFAEECDINTLMAKYEATGILPSHTNANSPRYLDVSDIPDLRTTLDQLNTATDSFMALPAAVRREFDNDAVKFVEFAQDPDNIEKLREWNLAPPAKVPEPPMRVEVVGGPPAGSDAEASVPAGSAGKAPGKP